jgi:hypothetical protein
MAHNGSRFPMPPGPLPGGMPPLVVAAPIGPEQMLSLLGAILLAREPAPAIEDDLTRTQQAELAVVRAIDLMSAAGYHFALGSLRTSYGRAKQAGEADAKAALEAEPSRGPAAPTPEAQPTPKIITE